MKYQHDLIGDIHGQGDRLERILSELGYDKTGSGYRHSERKALFLGDLIDRGNQNRQVINIVREMVENGNANAILGNHELNAIGFHGFDESTGLPLRPHTEKNVHQHKTFLAEYPLKDPETQSAIKWFKTLPLFIEFGEFRIVHACWDNKSIEFLGPGLFENNSLKPDMFQSVFKAHTREYLAIEILLKGPEITLPEGSQIIDKSGHVRNQIRTKWWSQKTPHSYRSIALTRTEFLEIIPELEITNFEYPVEYSELEKPVFVGHYSLDPETQNPPLSSNIFCLDFSGTNDPPITAYSLEPGTNFDDRRIIQI